MENKIKRISQRAYPSREEVPKYIAHVEQIEDARLRRILKIILCSGLRVGEAINSYIYKDEDGITVRCVAEKIYKPNPDSKAKRKHIAAHKQFKRGFLGEQYLNNLVRSDAQVFRSKTLINLFNLDMGELADLMTTDQSNPTWIGKGCTYKTLYRILKKSGVLDIKYRTSKREKSIRTDFIPSFHFYRKLFSSEYSLTAKGNGAQSVAATVDYMGWENADMLFSYVKDY